MSSEGFTKANIPTTVTAHHATWSFKQAVGTIPAHDFLRYASGTFDLVTVLTVQQLFRWVQGEIRSGRSRIKCLFLLLFFINILIIWLVRLFSTFVGCGVPLWGRFLWRFSRPSLPGRIRDRRVGTGTGDIGVWKWTGHCVCMCGR